MQFQGIPFDGRGWWDAKWFQEHLMDKISSAKDTLGLP